MCMWWGECFDFKLISLALLMQEARTMLLKGVALWLPSCRQGKKEEGKEMEGWEEEEEGGKDVGASASVLTPANMGEEEVGEFSHS